MPATTRRPFVQPSRPANRPATPLAVPPPPRRPGGVPSSGWSSSPCCSRLSGYGGHLGYQWWTEGRFMVRTDDAYVQGDITLLAAHAEGYVPPLRSSTTRRCAPVT